MTKAEVDLESAGGDHGQSDTTPQNRGCCTWTRFLVTMTYLYFLIIGSLALEWSWIGVHDSIFLRQISFFGLLPGKIEHVLKVQRKTLSEFKFFFSLPLLFRLWRSSVNVSHDSRSEKRDPGRGRFKFKVRNATSELRLLYGFDFYMARFAHR